jgi:hypothetical protein
MRRALARRTYIGVEVNQPTCRGPVNEELVGGAVAVCVELLVPSVGILTHF